MSRTTTGSLAVIGLYEICYMVGFGTKAPSRFAARVSWSDMSSFDSGSADNRQRPQEFY